LFVKADVAIIWFQNRPGLPITKDTWSIRDASSPFNIRLAGEGVTLEQTWRGMEDVLAANLTCNIGISNYNAALIMDMCRYAKVMPAVHQFEAHVMFQRSELVDLGNKLGIHSTMFSILGSGKEGPLQNHVVAGLAAKYSVKPAAICIAWGIKQGCCVLAKSIQRDRIQANFDAENVALDSTDLETLKTEDCNLRTLTTFEYWGFEAYS
jgi:D-xylose reductase